MYKSPLNYVGNKYKLLPQLLRLFPKDINNFIDLFSGGCDVTINTPAENKYANDINFPVIEILLAFQQTSIEKTLEFIDNRIAEFNLSKTNEEGYLQYREKYNNGTYNSPLDLFTLSRFSYNQLFRFNKHGEFNNAFGKNRSSFNDNMRNNLILTYPSIQDIHLSTQDFRKFKLDNIQENDFFYIDPPYLIARADYNTGKTAGLSWTEKDELDLYNFLDNLTKFGIKWGFSNFLKHKNKTNTMLYQWLELHEYHMYNIQADYSKLTNKVQRKEQSTLEILITNYD